MPKNDQNIDFSQSLEQTVVLATHNAGKVQELREALTPFGWTTLGASDLKLNVPDENGTTFRENAALKAIAASNATGKISLADDSGLEVDALGGLPGLDTANYGGWEKLLDNMKDVPTHERSARFICVLALHIPDSETYYFEGICNGSISLTAVGDGGFGYDPVFRPNGDLRTFAEMTKTEKQTYSHRGMAVDSLLSALKSAHHAL